MFNTHIFLNSSPLIRQLMGNFFISVILFGGFLALFVYVCKHIIIVINGL